MKIYRQLLWDDWNVAHIAKHHVTPEEVEEVVFSSGLRVRRGRGQKVYYVFGQTEAGRYLFIVLLNLGRRVGRIITARDMSEKEKRWYRH